MINEKSIVRAVGALNMRTKSGDLKWTTANLPQDWYVDNSYERIINPAYDTIFDGRHLRIFKYTYRYYTDEESYVLTAGYKLCFIDSQGLLSWEFPDDRSIRDLYETIKYKVADLESFFNKFAPEDDKEDKDDELPF